MTTSLPIPWDIVAEALRSAASIAFDGCHKIYVLMDEDQTALMRHYEYDKIITSSESSPEQMLETVKEWYEDSCSLRLVSAVTSVDGGLNKGFKDLIPQR